MEKSGIEMRVLELVCAKLCHDLVSPVSAVGNGIEILTDLDPKDPDDGLMFDEALKILSDSGKRATHILKFLRAAYGTGARGLQGGARELQQIASDYLGEKKITLVWETDHEALQAFGSQLVAKAAARGIKWSGDELAPSARLLLNGLSFIGEALPFGGEIILRTEQDGFRITGSGKNPRLRPESLDALTGKLAAADVPAAAVQACHLRLVCEEFDLSPEVTALPDSVTMICLPS